MALNVYEKRTPTFADKDGGCVKSGASGWITRFKGRRATCGGVEESSTFISIEAEPGALGTPDMMPVVPQSVSAAGRTPLVIPHVKVAFPPVTLLVIVVFDPAKITGNVEVTKANFP